MFKVKNLTIALFGEGDSGKTTFISSFYGNQRTPHFTQKYGYQVNMDDPSKSNELVSIFFGMKDNKKFAESTVKFTDYKFTFLASPTHNKGISFTIFDYPGQWWLEEVPEKYKQKERQTHLNNISKSDVGVLLIDGDLYQKDKEKYVKRLFDQFRQRFQTLRSNSIEKLSFPRTWIFAVTKVDGFSESVPAETLKNNLIRDASDQINQLFNELFSDGQKYNLYALALSSVYGIKDEVIDVSKFRGLHIIAPIVFKSAIESRIKQSRLRKVILNRL